MTTGPRFPFSAVVGQDDLKLALLLNAVDPAVGGVLLRGQKGSAKTTLARGLAALLGAEAPFVELPVGATEDRLVGTLDLAAVLSSGQARLQPGLLHAAHGGVLYVDEVNLLPDHLVDVLLDVAASGVNRVEREGVSAAHPSRFVLVGSMNPEEGELRPQLLDRFGLAVDVVASTDPDQRAEAVHRRLAFDADPPGFLDRWAAAEDDLRGRLAAARPAPLTPGLVRTVSALCASVGAEGLRADLVTCRAAAALAGWDGRTEATFDDVRRVAPLALAHRHRRSPLDGHGLDRAELDHALDEAEREGRRPGAGGPAEGGPGPADEAEAEREGGSPTDGREGDPGPAGRPQVGVVGDAGRLEPHPENRGAEREGRPPPDGRAEGPAPGARVAPPDRPTRVTGLAAPPPPRSRSALAPPSGRRSTMEGPRGRLVGDRPPTSAAPPLAAGATVRAAAVRRASDPDPGAAVIEPADLREAVRRHRTGNLIVLAVDASGSMGAEHRMEAAKGAVVSLLLDAYQRRDRVALVTFRDEGARVVLRPTGSVEVARARLADLPTGGRTPLASGILAALDVAERAAAHDGALPPLLVVVSDGRATAAPAGGDPTAAATEAAAQVRRRGVAAVVVDAEDGPTRLGLARDLAAVMGARYLTLPELSAGALDRAVRAARPDPATERSG